jgi:hypothetical protein
MSPEPEGHWQPLTLDALLEVMAGAAFPWWIAGGFAIECFVGRPLRPHADLDILVLHRNHLVLRTHLARWDCWASDPPGRLRAWPVGETLDPMVHDVWCRRGPGAPWLFQVMLDHSDGAQWRSRRCPAVMKAVAELGLHDAAGRPFLAPEVQLFYKAKSPRPKDVLDFDSALPLLSAAQRLWLVDAIVAAYGPDHPWLGALRAERRRG